MAKIDVSELKELEKELKEWSELYNRGEIPIVIITSIIATMIEKAEQADKE